MDISAEPDSIRFMKFRTDNAWGDDYGSCLGENFVWEFTGTVLAEDICPVGFSDALQVKFPASGDYRFELNEDELTFRIELLEP